MQGCVLIPGFLDLVWDPEPSAPVSCSSSCLIKMWPAALIHSALTLTILQLTADLTVLALLFM